MSGGINGSCPPCQQPAQPAQNAAARIQDDQSKALDVMKDMATGKVSAEDGMKQLQSLVVDQAVATGALPASASPTAVGATGKSSGFSMVDSFDSGGSRPALLDLKGGGAPAAAPAAAPAQDLSFLATDSGGGSKPGIGSGTNAR